MMKPILLLALLAILLAGCSSKPSFLMADGSRVTNEFLFSDPSSPKLVELVRNTLKKACDEEARESVANISELPQRPFCLTAEGLGFGYEQYEVYMYALSGFLPLEEVKPFLTEEALKLFE